MSCSESFPVQYLDLAVGLNALLLVVLKTKKSVFWRKFLAHYDSASLSLPSEYKVYAAVCEFLHLRSL
jgi:hypothetical protein